MTGYYKDNDSNFKVKHLTEWQVEEMRFLRKLSGRYAVVGVLSFPMAILMISQKRGWAAFWIWILGSFANAMSGYYRRRMQEVSDE